MPTIPRNVNITTGIEKAQFKNKKIVKINLVRPRTAFDDDDELPLVDWNLGAW